MYIIVSETSYKVTNNDNGSPYSSGGSIAGCLSGRVNGGLVKFELVQELHHDSLQRHTHTPEGGIKLGGNL